MLTRKQFELLRFIHERLTEAGIPPSFDEMKDALDLRSSSAVISRWMPDLERRSRASFISSNEGGIPASVSRSWMKRRSSNCLRVSIYLSPALFFARSLAGPFWGTGQKQIMNGHYLFDMCSATI